MLGWSNCDKLGLLGQALKGKALQYFVDVSADYPFGFDFEEASQMLVKRFGKVPSEIAAMAILQGIKQEVGETLWDFADRVRKNAIYAYGKQRDDKCAIRHFLTGLRDREVANVVASNTDPALETNLVALVQYIQKLTDRRQYLKVGHVKSVNFAEAPTSYDHVETLAVSANKGQRPATHEHNGETDIGKLTKAVAGLAAFPDRLEARLNSHWEAQSQKEAAMIKVLGDIQNVLVSLGLGSQIQQPPMHTNRYSFQQPMSTNGLGGNGNDGRYRARPNSPGRVRTCYICNSTGHFRAQCPHNRNSSQSRRTSTPVLDDSNLNMGQPSNGSGRPVSTIPNGQSQSLNRM